MADQNNIPEAEDTKTKVTAKISTDTPGREVPKIDLSTPANTENKSASNTMTGRTMKLQGLAGMAPPKPSVDAAPAASAAPEAEAAGSDTRTKRTVKLASLAAEPTIKSIDLNKPKTNPKPVFTSAPVPVSAPAQEGSASTVTRRTQKLEALDTQDVAAMTEVAPSAGADTQTRKAAKIAAVAAQPAPQSVSRPRQTVKVEGIAPVNAPAAGPATVQLAGPAPETKSPVKPVDDAPKTIQVPGTAPATQSPVRPVEAAPNTIQIAAPAADTQTRAATKVAKPDEQEKFKAGNVDDTVKLQRPAPKPVMPGSVAPTAQGGTSAAGGIKLNKPKPAPKPAAKPAPKAEPEEAKSEPEEKPQDAAQSQEPTGNHGKDQTPPKKKKGLKVNTDAIKDLGSSPAAASAGAAGVVSAVPGGAAAALPTKQVKESLGINISFAIFGVMALLILVFVALVATFDYLNIWEQPGQERIDLPIISEQVYSKLNK